MAEGGRSRISLELRPELLNSFEVSHGGVIMTMLDVAMAVAARSQQKHRGRRDDGGHVAQLPAPPAKGRIVAEGKVLRGGRSLYFCEGEAFDEAANWSPSRWAPSSCAEKSKAD
jgi:acyl-coenzyme A thioesterase PaaI-like protein